MFNVYTVFVTGLLQNKYTIYIQHNYMSLKQSAQENFLLHSGWQDNLKFYKENTIVTVQFN